jgi:hypothetical protein
LVEDAISMKDTILFWKILLHFASLLHQASIDELGKPNIMLRQVKQLPSKLHSEIVDVHLVRNFDPE